MYLYNKSSRIQLSYYIELRIFEVLTMMLIEAKSAKN